MSHSLIISLVCAFCPYSWLPAGILHHLFSFSFAKLAQNTTTTHTPRTHMVLPHKRWFHAHNVCFSIMVGTSHWLLVLYSLQLKSGKILIRFWFYYEMNATFLSSTSVFNIDDNGKKCFLSSKSAYKNMRPSLKIFWFAVTAIFFKKRVGR